MLLMLILTCEKFRFDVHDAAVQMNFIWINTAPSKLNILRNLILDNGKWKFSH